MTSIKCPKCGKQISDKSVLCAYCGEVLNKGKMVTNIESAEDSRKLYDMIIVGIRDDANKSQAIRILKSVYEIPKRISTKMLDETGSVFVEGIKENNVKYISMQFNTWGYDVDFIESKSTRPNLLNVDWEKYGKQFAFRNMPHEPRPIPEPVRIHIDNTPLYCPRCGSTAITTGARGVNFTWGLIGAGKTVNRCGKCGYTWKPGK